MGSESPNVILPASHSAHSIEVEVEIAETGLHVSESMEGLESTESIDHVLGRGDEEGREDGNALPQEGWEDDMDMEKKMSYVEYLKSPIITLQIGSPPHETTLSAHLALLQSSPWFNDQCADYTTETPTYLRTVHLPDDDIDAVGAFLEYLYTKEYSPRLVAGPSGKPEDMVLEDAGDADLDEGGDRLLKHAKVYTLAEKLRIPELKHLAHSKIHRINSTAKGELKYAKFVYENTTRDDDTIRKPIASFWAHRSHVLRHEAEDEFKSMVLEFPQFAYDILSIVLDQKEKGKDKDKEHHRHQRPTLGDESTEPIGAAKTPRTGRKRPRTSTAYS